MGIKRKVDELGRIVIPKEFRKEIHIKEGDYVEMDLKGKQVIVKKSNNTDKETPLKPVMVADEGFDASVSSHLCCARCKQPIINVWSSREYKPKYCHYCGQAHDWSDQQ